MLALQTLLVAVASAPGLPRSDIELTETSIEGVSGTALRGRLEVPEDRGGDAPDGRRMIGLNVVVLPRGGELRDGRALYVLQGGPGQAASELVPFYARVFAPLREEWDLVFVDQRGTGGSNPLRLVGPPEAVLDELDELFPPAWVDASREELGQHADLDEYTTEAAVLDLDDVRAALGHERVDLYGTSYGTRVAQAYVRRFPAQVRSLALKAVAPLDLVVGADYGVDAQAALERLLDDFEADPRCAEAIPDLRTEFWDLLERLEREPAHVRVTNPLTQREQQVELGRGAAAGKIRSMLYAPTAASQVPALIHGAYGGDLSQLAALAVRVRMSYATSLYAGMSLSVLAAEDAPRARQEGVASSAAPSFLGNSWFESMTAACARWPRGRVDPGLFAPLRSDVPALLLSGGLDPALPPRWGEAAARGLTRARHVVIPNAGHSFDLIEGCADLMLVQFVRAADPAAVDDSCAAGIARPPFVLPAPASR